MPKKIIIVGSGVFGLTSALHLTDAGYSDITIYDRLNLYDLQYSFENGADTASSDINKVFRAFYPGEEHYHRLALKAKAEFLKWEKELLALSPEEAAEKFNIHGERKLLSTCGKANYMETGEHILEAGIEAFTASGLRDTQYVLNNPEDTERAKKDGWYAQMNFFENNGDHPILQKLKGVFDSTSGLLAANKACLYVNSVLKSRGVKFVTGEAGTVEILKETGDVVEGIVTADGKVHLADLVIVACGPWSPKLVPQLAGFSEAMNGNVAVIKIPEDRPDLFKKYHPDNFPLLAWRAQRSVEQQPFSGVSIFPSSPEGLVKFIVRQRRYANPQKLSDGTITSVPVTIQSNPPETRLSRLVLSELKQFIKVFCPDLAPLGIHKTQLLWYTNTINNDFIVDYAPGKKNLLVVTGGSGHGFKFLPVLGEFVVDVIEGRENDYTKIFKWRDPAGYHDVNHVGQVKTGGISYYEQELSTPEDLKITAEDLKRPLTADRLGLELEGLKI